MKKIRPLGHMFFIMMLAISVIGCRYPGINDDINGGGPTINERDFGPGVTPMSHDVYDNATWLAAFLKINDPAEYGHNHIINLTYVPGSMPVYPNPNIININDNQTIPAGVTVSMRVNPAVRVSVQGDLPSGNNINLSGIDSRLILRSPNLTHPGPDLFLLRLTAQAGTEIVMHQGIIRGNYPNSATATGSGITVNGGSLTMYGGEIRNHREISSGGGVNVIDGTFILRNGEISNNRASYGGGVSVGGNNSTFTMYNGTISGNRATVGNGGGVNVSNGADFIMKSGTISGNEATAQGNSTYFPKSTF